MSDYLLLNDGGRLELNAGGFLLLNSSGGGAGFIPRDSVAGFTTLTLPTASISVPSMETSVVVPGLPEGTVE